MQKNVLYNMLYFMFLFRNKSLPLVQTGQATVGGLLVHSTVPALTALQDDFSTCWANF